MDVPLPGRGQPPSPVSAVSETKLMDFHMYKIVFVLLSR